MQNARIICFFGSLFFAALNIIDTILYFFKTGTWAWSWGTPWRIPLTFNVMGSKFSLSSIFEFTYRIKDSDWWIYCVIKDFICLYDLFWVFLVFGILFKVFDKDTYKEIN